MKLPNRSTGMLLMALCLIASSLMLETPAEARPEKKAYQGAAARRVAAQHDVEVRRLAEVRRQQELHRQQELQRQAELRRMAEIQRERQLARARAEEHARLDALRRAQMARYRHAQPGGLTVQLNLPGVQVQGTLGPTERHRH